MTATPRQEAVLLSETTVCPNCSASIPVGASFCTSCGQSVAAAAPVAAPEPPAPPAPPAWEPPPVAPAPPVVDPTNVETPGLHDTTQVLPATPPAPPAWEAPPAPAPAAWSPPPAPAPSAAPWAPADAPASPAAPAPAWGAPPAAAPAPAAPGAWDQPAAPAWGDPGQSAAPAWSTPPAATPSSSGGSPLGGLAAIIGGVLVLVGIFSAWLGSDVTSATIKGWDLTSGDKFLKSSDPYILLALGIVALAIGVALFLGKVKGLVKVAAIVLGLAVVGICVRDWMSISDLVKKNAAFQGVTIKSKFGFYLTIAGGVLAAVGGLIPAKKS